MLENKNTHICMVLKYVPEICTIPGNMYHSRKMSQQVLRGKISHFVACMIMCCEYTYMSVYVYMFTYRLTNFSSHCIEIFYNMRVREKNTPQVYMCLFSKQAAHMYTQSVCTCTYPYILRTVEIHMHVQLQPFQLAAGGPDNPLTL